MTYLLRRYRRHLAFALKVGLFYGAWYALYDLWLLPDGRLDQAVARSVASLVGGLVNGIGMEALVEGRYVIPASTRGVVVANGCNGLSTIGLFMGFVATYPGQALRRALFLPLGALVIYLVNVVRVFVMTLCLKHWAVGFDIMHGFGMTSLFYVVILALWMVWVNYGGSRRALA